MSTIFLVFIIFLVGSFIFYEFAFLATERSVSFEGEPLRFRENNYFSISERWEENDRIVNSILNHGEYLELQEETSEKPEVPEKDEEEEWSESEEEIIEEEREEDFSVHTVVSGDNLWDLAQKNLGSGFRWVEIKDEDGEGFPDWRAEVLEPGQKVFIPADGE